MTDFAKSTREQRDAVSSRILLAKPLTRVLFFPALCWQGSRRNNTYPFDAGREYEMSFELPDIGYIGGITLSQDNNPEARSSNADWHVQQVCATSWHVVPMYTPVAPKLRISQDTCDLQ